MERSGTAVSGLMAFPKLKGSANYKDWARSMKGVLMYEGLWEEMQPPTFPEGVFQITATGTQTNQAIIGKEAEAQAFLTAYSISKKARI